MKELKVKRATLAFDKHLVANLLGVPSCFYSQVEVDEDTGSVYLRVETIPGDSRELTYFYPEFEDHRHLRFSAVRLFNEEDPSVESIQSYTCDRHMNIDPDYVASVWDALEWELSFEGGKDATSIIGEWEITLGLPSVGDPRDTFYWGMVEYNG